MAAPPTTYGAIFDSGEVQLVDSRLSVTGDLEMSRLTSFDAEATAAASLHLRRSLVEVTGAFTSGEGDLLEIAIDGAVRGSEYGALDVGSARLGGDLQVDFAGFTGVDMAYVFDLIVADAVGAVTGDFTGLSVLGLSPLYAVSTGLEQGDFGAGLVDVYRLRIEQVVSSPSALALMLLSLAWFPAAQWRNRHVSLRE